MKKIISTLIVVGAISSLSYAQSSFLPKGTSGAILSANYAANNQARGFGGGIGYSFDGTFDLGLAINNMNSELLILGEEFSVMTFTPYASVFLVKQDETTPFSLSMDGSYQHQVYSNDPLDNNDVEMTGNYYTIGATLYTTSTTGTARIQPSIGFTYLSGDTKVNDGAGGEVSEESNATVFNVGLSLLFGPPSRNCFALTPTLGFNDGTTTFGVSVSLVIPQREIPK